MYIKIHKYKICKHIFMYTSSKLHHCSNKISSVQLWYKYQLNIEIILIRYICIKKLTFILLYMSLNLFIKYIDKITYFNLYSRLKHRHCIHISSSYSLSPYTVWRTSPVSTFHIFTVLSIDPDTTLVPSGEKATE